MIRLQDNQKTSSSDSGLTLIELLVAMGIGFLVLALLSSMLIGISGSQERISQSSVSLSEAQVASDVFRSVVRSSTGGVVQSVQVSGRSGQLLVTRTLENLNTLTWSPGAYCSALFWHPDGHILWAKSNNSQTIPSVNSLSGWTELASPIQPVSPEAPVFSKNGLQYTMTFVAKPTNGVDATIKVSLTAPNLESEVSGGCY